jgi:hypothetical protein
MIARLQELITKDDDKMLRPRLLTNVNVMNPFDLALNQPVIQQVEIARTTVSMHSATTPIPEFDTTQQAIIVNSDNEWEELTTIETTEEVISNHYLNQTITWYLGN